MTGEHDRDRRLEEVSATIDALEKFWFKHPELRLGQILVNAGTLAGLTVRPNPLWEFSDLGVQVGLAALQTEIDLRG